MSLHWLRPFLGAGDKDRQTLYYNGALSGEDLPANTNMDSILMSMAVGGIHVKLYDISPVKHGGGCSALLSPATLYCTLSNWGVTLPALRTGNEGGAGEGHGNVRGGCLNVKGREGCWGLYTLTQQQRLRLGGSGVCIVLCAKATNRSHFLFLAAGYIIIRLAGHCCGWWVKWSLHPSFVPLQCTTLWQ